MHVRSVLSTHRPAAFTLALALTLSGCKSSPPAAPTDDASLSAAVQNRLTADTALGPNTINSSVQNGVATLNGTVANDAARSLAANDAAQVAGLKTVVNNLTVQPPAPPPAAEAAVVPPPPPPVTPRKKPAAKMPAPVIREDAPPPPPPVQQAYVPPPAPPVHTAPPPPAFRTITVPAAFTIPIRITQTLDSASTQQGDTFTGTVASDVLVEGVVALRQGTPVTGRVDAVQEAAHFKGNSLLTVELTSLTLRGQKIAVATEPYSVKGKGRGKNTAEKVGGGAAVGAILGGIFGGGSGAAIGAAAGGGLGAGANTITRGEQIQIASESLIRFNLANPISLKVPTRETGNSDSLEPRSRPALNAPDQTTGPSPQ